ncbi:MAG: hypothetical protein IPK19_36845 [Chloroflexi bacterium]|nr:hypothetical protein [Chloroflexota bacterium]
MMHTLINRSWFIPVFFVFVALAARLPHLATNGSPSDYDTINAWGESVYRHNFAFYAITSADHPPLFPIYAGLTNPLSDVPALAQAGLTDMVRLKLPSLAAILLLVAIVGYWLRNEGWTRLFVLTLLALHPGMIANSAVWTQSDSIFTLFLVLMLLMMRNDRPRVAWVFFALALLTKFQSIVLLPLLVVLTFRRYSWQELVRAAVGAAVIVVVVLLPFVLVSGLSALAPYLGSVNSFPHTTGNAYNIWVAFEPGYWARSLVHWVRTTPDHPSSRFSATVKWACCFSAFTRCSSSITCGDVRMKGASLSGDRRSTSASSCCQPRFTNVISIPASLWPSSESPRIDGWRWSRSSVCSRSPLTLSPA